MNNPSQARNPVGTTAHTVANVEAILNDRNLKFPNYGDLKSFEKWGI